MFGDPRPISREEVEVIRAAFAQGQPLRDVLPAAFESLPSLTVVARCPCGCASVDFSERCAAGSFCLGTGTEGGAILMPNDAGVCPAGSYNPGGAINTCVRQLSYACVPIPAACNGTITCGWAPRRAAKAAVSAGRRRRTRSPACCRSLDRGRPRAPASLHDRRDRSVQHVRMIGHGLRSERDPGLQRRRLHMDGEPIERDLLTDCSHQAHIPMFRGAQPSPTSSPTWPWRSVALRDPV
jgi:hypothetical protein